MKRNWMLTFFVVQNYVSGSAKGFNRTQYNCPYRYQCDCMNAFAIKEFSDRHELLQSGEHDRHSHHATKGILSVKQRNAVIGAVKAAPLSTGAAVHSNLKNRSPGNHVRSDKRSFRAVDRLVSNTRRELMAGRVDGVDIDGSEGSMVQLAESLSLKRFIERHNDRDDPFHLDEHQTVCVGYQFKNGVCYMTITTPHMLNNLARGENCGWQKQLHVDAAFNWCEKAVAVVGMGLNSMGAHYNSVSISIANSESKLAITNSFAATITGLLNLYQQVHLCDSEECGFCTQLREQVSGPDGRLFRQYLLSEDAARRHMHIEKPSSDATPQFFSWAHEKFDTIEKPVEVQQCHNHIGRKYFSRYFSRAFPSFPECSNHCRFLVSHCFQEEVFPPILRKGREFHLVSPSYCSIGGCPHHCHYATDPG